MKTLCLLDYHIVVDNLLEKRLYDGHQIQSHFTAREFNILGNSILIFRGPMRLTHKEMVDIKDVLREKHLGDTLISSDDTLHFIIEEFDVQPPNLELQYYRLRLLVLVIIETLSKKSIKVTRKGTDLYVDNKKLNVGIATVGKTSGKIHLGINIESTGAPRHVNITGLLDLGFNEEQLEHFALEIAENYVKEIKKVKEDCTKTQPI